MKREFLKNLGLEDESIDKIMAELGKETNTDKARVTELEAEMQKANDKITDYENKINDLSSKADENSKEHEELENLKKQIADEKANAKAQKDDEILTNNIIASFGDKKFVNDYTKQAIISDVKKALKDETNAGKSAKDIFEELTKDKQDIFENPNQIKDMSAMGDVPNSNDIDKAKFDKMSYKERLELKSENPELFEKLNK